jgi:hypothetical protein
MIAGYNQRNSPDMEPRLIYRTKDGRFARRKDVWQGPLLPDFTLMQLRERYGNRHAEVVAAVCRPNLLLQRMKVRH